MESYYMTMHSGDEAAVCDWNSIPVLKHGQFSKELPTVV